MLHLLFFVMTYLTDSRAAAEATHGGFALGLANAALVCLVLGGVTMRRWRLRRSQVKSLGMGVWPAR